MAETSAGPAIAPEELARRAEQATAARRGGPVRVRDVEPLLGGNSSLTYSARLMGTPEERIVLKVAPPGLEPVRNRDVLRQAKVFDVLAEAPGVAVPRVLGTSEGDPPEIPPLFVMNFVPGESYEPVLSPPRPDLSAEVIQSRAFAAARMLAALHRSPVSALSDERETDLVREVGRWTKAFSTVDDDLRGGSRAPRAQEKLEKALPESLPPVILHGDYRLGNMQIEGTQIGALIDWEIWSLGDPRLDLAWFLLNSDPRHPTSRAEGQARMPTAKELVAAYEEAAGRKVDDLGWFGALVRYKQAAASALIVKNNRRVAKEGVDVDRVEASISQLLDWSLEMLT